MALMDCLHGLSPKFEGYPIWLDAENLANMKDVFLGIVWLIKKSFFKKIS
jgi:hypothetical protein